MSSALDFISNQCLNVIRSIFIDDIRIFPIGLIDFMLLLQNFHAKWRNAVFFLRFNQILTYE